jgi:hypothetical protein
MVGLLQGMDSQSQTHLDVGGAAEDVDDSLSHILGFETLRVAGERVETRQNGPKFLPTTEVLSSIHIPTPALQKG